MTIPIGQKAADGKKSPAVAALHAAPAAGAKIAVDSVIFSHFRRSLSLPCRVTML
ncbi:hypothetical protein [Rhizobium sp. PAMB 3182]